MTRNASTTQNDQPRDNTTTTNERAKTLRQLIRKRNSTPTEDRRTTKDTTKTIKINFYARSKTTQEDNHHRHLEELPWTQQHDMHQNQTHDKVFITRMYDQQGITDLHFNDEGTRTRRRGHRRSTTSHNDAVHDAGTRQRHQTMN